MILSCLARGRNLLPAMLPEGHGCVRTVSQPEDPSCPLFPSSSLLEYFHRALSTLAVSFLRGCQPYQKHRGTSGVPSPYGCF